MDLAPRSQVLAAGPGLIVCLVALLSAVLVDAREAGEPQTVAAVDLRRYAGEWFEIARFPNRFQRECVGDVRASYTRRDDGRIDVTNRCSTAGGDREARGVARVVNRATNAKLEVRFAPALLSFLPSVWGDYWILGLSPDYDWSVVGSPDRKYLWILSRTRTLSEAAWTEAVGVARSAGFDTDRLVRTSHTTESAVR